MDEITSPSPFDAIRETDERGEFWSARNLMPLMEYPRWDSFARTVTKARDALALVQGADVATSNFLDVEKVSHAARGPAASDYRLTRMGAYLTAMAGDDTKVAVAAARIYFAVKAREAEVALAPQPMLPTNFEEALEALLVRVKNEKLLMEQNAVQAAEIKGKTERLMAIAPRAAVYERVMATDKSHSLGEAANYLYKGTQVEVGQNRLFKRLQELGWIFDKTQGRGSRRKWRPIQKALQLGYVTPLMPRPFLDPKTGEERLGEPQMRVTSKGLDWLMMHPEVLTVGRGPQETLPGL